MKNCRFKEQEREEFILLGPPHPGEIFSQDIFPHLSVSKKKLAKELGVSGKTVSRFLDKRGRVSADMALGLARLSGTSALYWLVLQAHHDAWRVQPEDDFRQSMRPLAKTTKASRKRQLV